MQVYAYSLLVFSSSRICSISDLPIFSDTIIFFIPLWPLPSSLAVAFCRVLLNWQNIFQGIAAPGFYRHQSQLLLHGFVLQPMDKNRMVDCHLSDYKLSLGSLVSLSASVFPCWGHKFHKLYPGLGIKRQIILSFLQLLVSLLTCVLL